MDKTPHLGHSEDVLGAEGGCKIEQDTVKYVNPG